MQTLTQSCISYGSEPPEGVADATIKALEPFDVRWSGAGIVEDGKAEHPNAAQFPGVLIPREQWFDAVRSLKEQAGFIMLTDHTAVDYPGRDPRFTVVGVLLNLETQDRLIAKTRVAEGESVASLASLWASADWAERETYDMFGIAFDGHPDLTRIYMPQDYDGWPMRKDFPLQGHLRFQD